MAVKSKSKRMVKPSVKAKAGSKSRVAVKSKSTAKRKGFKEKAETNKKLVTASKTTAVAAQPAPKKETVHSTAAHAPVAKAVTPVVKRVVTQMVERRRPTPRPSRVNQFAFMKAPGLEHDYEVGGGVEVFCDHEKNRERIRGWVKGIVVQVDNKMVAVQFRSNVYLTDGWMVPDRILWFPLNSEHMRPVPVKKPPVKDFIPEY